MESYVNNYSKIFKNENIRLKLFLNLILFLGLIISINNNYRKLLKNYNDELKYNNINEFKKHFSLKNLNNSRFFSITHFKYSFSFKFQKMKIEYNFIFYDEYNNIILPSDLALYNDLHILCNIELKDNIIIDSLSNIYKNKFFNCIEFFEINENIKFGIKINYNNKYSKIYYFTEKIFTYNNLNYQFDNIFDPLFINNEYNSLIKDRYEKEIKNDLTLKASYMEYPNYFFKRNLVEIKDKWNFKNIYNYYFCFCNGPNCIDKNITESCKYPFYLYIIDNNRDIYPKTDYLFIDFIFAELSSDDVFPIFEEMIKRNYPVHYITEKSETYKKYCENIKKCLIILPVIKEKNPINSHFLEKYLTLFLKLKIVVTGRGTTFNTNLFYNIEYITYICVGHGVCYFKYYLYNHDRIYGIKKNNKLLIPPSDKIISIAKKYGWKDEDIIKINLPRWDKYNSNEISKIDQNEIHCKNNSIFIMFTWRNMKKNKLISSFYIDNILNLVTNDTLNEIITNNNITLYLSFHRLIDEKYIKKFKKILIKHKSIELINQNDISECLSKADLTVSDFSSIIFDFMYRRKPFIIYIPDGNDPHIKEIYKHEYY